ncbi:hypothetical protein COP2_016995 [Malus domestica]
MIVRASKNTGKLADSPESGLRIELQSSSNLHLSNVVGGTLLSRIDVVAGSATTGKLMKAVGNVEPKLGSRVLDLMLHANQNQWI